MQELIVRKIQSLGENFQKNEIAYLALTTKIELPFRDRLAFVIFKEIGSDHCVCREWKRTDLAILKDQEPKVLIELKAMYSFDAVLDIDGIGGFTEAMSNDAEKAFKLAKEDTAVYTVLLATHPESLVAPHMNGIVKYVPGINKAIKKFGGAYTVRETAIQAVDNDLKGKNVVAKGALPGGEAFTTQVSILYWVVKA